MKKIVRMLLVAVMLVCTVGCAGVKSEKYTLKDFENKTFNGRLGGQFRVVIDGQPFKYEGKEMVFLDKKATFLSYATREDVILEDGTRANIPFVYENVRIVEDGGKYYIMADRLPERLEIVDKDHVKTHSDRNEFWNISQEAKK